MKTIDVLRLNEAGTAGQWRAEAEYRRSNAGWLKYSKLIALKVRARMSEQNVTQVQLADRLGCSQQQVSALLKGETNMTLETVSRLEAALDFDLIGEALAPVSGYTAPNSTRQVYLSEPDAPEYGTR